MPRLVGVETGLEILLQGRNLQGHDAVDAGLVHAVVDEGREICAAEAWLLSDAAHCIQPWDRPGHCPLAHGDYAAVVEAHRTRELTRMLGHEPAPLAILECVELGLMQPLDGAIRSEMSVFARLIQRPEPRNMIRTMFLGKQAWDKARRDGAVDPEVERVEAQVNAIISDACNHFPELRRAGFLGGEGAAIAQSRMGDDYWLAGNPVVSEAVKQLATDCAQIADQLSSVQQLQLDHRLAAQKIVPAYLGALSGLLFFGSPSSATRFQVHVRP
jgi:3-hydroxyacyl-CoA dehydrogenase/enoyl-CoA hydratase/3-hydroxybutyryl-CoA epimerase